MATARRKKRSRGPRINAPIPAHQQPTPPLARVHARRFPPTLHSRTTFRRLTFKNSTPPFSPLLFPSLLPSSSTPSFKSILAHVSSRYVSIHPITYFTKIFYNIFINSLNCFRRFDDSQLRKASKASLVRTFSLEPRGRENTMIHDPTF